MEYDDELPEDEEEILVYVEFDGFIDSHAFSNEKLQLDMIGIDTEHPMMQINGRFYEGTYEDVVGTYMFFTKNEDTTVDDPVFDTAPSLKYFTKTRKMLTMQRVFTKPRTEVLGDSEHPDCIPNIDTLKKAGVPLKYQEQALCFWKNIRDIRLKALNTYLEKQRIRAEKKAQGIPLDSESDEDSPFATYKLDDDFKDSDEHEHENDTELENDYQSYNEDVSLSKHISPDHFGVNEGASTSKDTTSHNLENFMVIDPVPSTSKCDVDPLETLRAKILVPQKKKVRVIHDPRKKKCKKKKVSEKSKEKIVNVMEELHEEEQYKTDLEESEMSGDNKIENTEKDDDQTVIDKLKPESSEPISMDNKVLKQQKREAKMKEISERLKIKAQEYVNKKMD